MKITMSKVIAGISIFFSIILGFIGFDAYVVSSDEMKQFEVKVVQTFQQFKMTIGIETDMMILESLRREERRLEQWLREKPGDRDTILALERVREDMRIVKERIRKRVNGE